MCKNTFEVRTFLTEDGLPHNEFNLTAHYQAKDGTLYFDGLGGLISFHPSHFAGQAQNQAPLEIMGKGISFEIYLPVLEPAQAQPLVEEPPRELAVLTEVYEETPYPAAPVSVSGKQSKLELLLIEDNEEMREYIRYCIDSSQYNITEAADGEEGLQKAQALIPDLIISDVMMPKKNGFEVTKAIRSHIGTSHIPLILLTAKAFLESRLKGLRRGADAYLTKPFSPQDWRFAFKNSLKSATCCGAVTRAVPKRTATSGFGKRMNSLPTSEPISWNISTNPAGFKGRGGHPFSKKKHA